MAQSKKVNASNRRGRLEVRLTADELAQIDERAAQAGMVRSEYVRQMALHGKVVVKQTRQADKALIFQLMKIGTNLNQVVHASHIRGRLPESFPALCEEISRLVVKAAEEVDAE